MTKLSIIMVESKLIECKGQTYPIVVLIGRDEKGVKRYYQKKYFPYFYLAEKDYMELKDNGYFEGMHVQSVEGCKARNLMKRVMSKVTVADAGRVTDSIKAINKMNKVSAQSGLNTLNSIEQLKTIWTYEADLSKSDLLPLRLLIDKGIKSGVDIEGEELIPIDMNCKLRKWYIDFEAYTVKEYSSGLGIKEPIIMVSVWDNYLNKMYTYYSVNTTWKVDWQIRQFFIPFTEFPHEVKAFKTEAMLLDALMELLIELDPDMLIAWNLNRYDIEKWKQRVDFNKNKCIHPFRDISPMHSILWNSKPRRVKGRVLFDLMVAFKEFTDAEIRSYALGYITEEEKLGFPKIPFVGTSGHTWDIAPEVMFKRNVYDVLIEKALDDKYEISETYNDLRTEFGTLFHETFVRHRVIDTVLMRLVHGKVVLKTCDYGKTEEEHLLGAIVKEPKSDKHYWVGQFDFGREYPNIIKGFNISPETYVDHEIDKDCFIIEYNIPDKGNMVFRFIKDRIGLLPQLIKFFDDKRDEYEIGRARSIANGESEDKIKVWDRRSYNVKKTSNAIYGVMDFPKFRLNRKECTQATAIVGRISIEELTKFLYDIGYELLYADTDSLFVLFHSNTPEDCLKEGQELQKKLNEHLSIFFTEKYGVEKAPADLGFKKIYKKIMFFGKKNYAGKYVYDEHKGWKEDYDIKGIASVRTDSSMLERSTLETLLKLVLNDEYLSTINGFIDKVLEDFKARKYGYLEVSYPAQIKQKMVYDEKKKSWITDYAKLNKKGRIQIPAHITSAIYSNLYLNTDFGEGDKPRRLPVKFPKKKLKLKKGQVTLFANNEHIYNQANITKYPLEWEFYGKTRRVNAISVVEDMTVPPIFLEHIDWDKIEKRLKAKLDKVVNTNKTT